MQGGRIGLSALVLVLALAGGVAAQEVVTKQYDDGSVYEGTFKNGRQDGTGTYTLPNGYSYSGEWVAGEIRGKGIMDEAGNWAEGIREEIERTVRETVKKIGYEQDGFHWSTASFQNHLHGQSAHIAQGVDESGNKDEGAVIRSACGDGNSHLLLVRKLLYYINLETK